MRDIDSFLEKVENGKPARAGLPLLESAEKTRVPCVYIKRVPPKFDLQFPGSDLPVNKLDLHRKCEVLFDVAGQNVSISADIEKVGDINTLHLVGKDLINHQQMRDYFRVDVSTPIIASSLVPEDFNEGNDTWRMSGETIDVSGGGLLCLFKTPIKEGTRVRIDLVLPTADAEVIKAVGHVVRCRRIDDSTFQVGLNFDAIEPETHDKIMACCFEIQRKHLRLKVQVKTP